MKKIVLMISMTIGICSCATTGNYEKMLSSWVGVSADRLVSTWGPPSNSYDLTNGGKVLEYVKSGSVTVGGYTQTVPQTTYHSGTASAYSPYGTSAYGSYSGTSTTYVQSRTPTYNIPMLCKTRFSIDPYGLVSSWGWEGNNCKAYPPKQK